MTATHFVPVPLVGSPPAQAIFPRVVFGIDFGSASLAAARWASQFVATRAEAIVSHVASPDTVALDDDPLDDQTSIRRLMPALAGGLGGFAATLDSKLVRTVVRIGKPSHWLAAIASGAEAHLVVLGRRSDANRKTIGEPNVIERLSRRASCSVLVVPEGVAAAPQCIVAAVDQSTFATRVIRIARRLARLHELPLTVLHVLAPSTGGSDRRVRRVDTIRRPVWVSPGDEPSMIPPRVSTWLDELARSPDAVTRERVELAVGDAPREIISSGLTAGTSLIVTGIRGADGAVPGSIGSVARELLARAPMPVLAINAT
jgi:nucleotide-binding universal stress UspA family protein